MKSGMQKAREGKWNRDFALYGYSHIDERIKNTMCIDMRENLMGLKKPWFFLGI